MKEALIKMLNAGLKVLKINKHGSLLLKKHKSGLVSVTPIPDEKFKGLEISAVWIDESQGHV